MMGSPKDEAERSDAEGPQHQVKIVNRFALGRHAVTVGEYRRFVAATGHDHGGGVYVWTGSEWKRDPAKSWEDPGFAQDDRHPVVGVSRRDAEAFVAWLSGEVDQPYRLPTEAEWEYACRSATATAFSFGPTITIEQANYDGNYVYGEGSKGIDRQKSVVVGSLPANPWGVHEMHGNVFEWVEDGWHENYTRAPEDGLAWTDGEGRKSSPGRLARGGSWYYDPRDCRSAGRVRGGPDSRDLIIGFRLARTLS
ncbi:formylglycine-generating enzyme family protein [Defluviicoccus vanus]|uniref:Formylglycine-generating enzyme family protein n=2 Tax=Defluviicoccus vanus TaxID=111831 RepID=A0A7H1MYZ4_9PROT|nr:formylglycine-generating enzyme family protein [Defluviicoccus vanus]